MKHRYVLEKWLNGVRRITEWLRATSLSTESVVSPGEASERLRWKDA